MREVLNYIRDNPLIPRVRKHKKKSEIRLSGNRKKLQGKQGNYDY